MKIYCENCGINIVQENHINCECESVWCSKECAEKDGLKIINAKTNKGIEEIERNCSHCRAEDFTDTEVLEFILGNMVDFLREDVINQMRGEA